MDHFRIEMIQFSFRLTPIWGILGTSFWTKNPTRIILSRFGDFIKNLILGTELASFSDKKLDHIPDFFVQLTPFPKSDLCNFCWIFCPEMTLAQFPEFGFCVQNSRIGVKY